MGELFLHIGSHKTGTTSIQKGFTDHRAVLAAAGVNYITFDEAGRHLVHAEGAGAGFTVRINRRAADRHMVPSAAINFASREGFFWVYDPREVQALADLIRPRFDRVTILVYLRRQDLLANSHRRQVAADGETPAARFYGVLAEPLPRHAPYLDRYFDYAGKLNNVWAAAFGAENIVPVPFERAALRDGDVVADVLHRIGVEALDALEVPVRNMSDGLHRTWMKLKLAELGAPRRLRSAILEQMPEKTGKFLPSRAQAAAFLAHYDASNERLAESYSFDGRPFRFDPSLEMYPEKSSVEFSAEDTGRMLAAVIAGSTTMVNEMRGRKQA